MKRFLHILILLVLLAVFVSLGLMVKDTGEGILFDVGILEAIHNNPNQTVFKFMQFVSFIGSEIFLFPAVGLFIIIALINKRYFISKLLLLNTLGSFMLNYLLKLAFNRTRPLDYILVEQGGLSYPSGHSMVVMSMYLTIAYLLTREKYNPRLKKTVYSLASIIILLMGISRLFLGVHWPTDVIGGFIMGYIWYSVTIMLVKE